MIAATGIVVGSPLIWVERALVVLVAASRVRWPSPCRYLWWPPLAPPPNSAC
ncbi:hypothetical protein I553_5920 [Mycobacterium xenopi 4042]|uniref:Uncharacterized protein n=1 Tax=Mycobacterium xenopi 4042 TaxID=1299334 RepID=X8BEZ1_MYCXE|nr:hypothetical protein I553_5920 [Mycobacterium xenopi 4042]